MKWQICLPGLIEDTHNSQREIDISTYSDADILLDKTATNRDSNMFRCWHNKNKHEQSIEKPNRYFKMYRYWYIIEENQTE